MESSSAQNVIDELTQDLQAVKPLASPFKRTCVSAVPALVLLIALMWYIQPFRPGFFAELGGGSRFSLEVLLGYSAALLSIALGYVLAVPGAREERSVTALAVFTASALFIFFAYSLNTPSLPVTMAGKREICIFETFLYGIALAFILFAFHRRSIFLKRKTAAFSGTSKCSR